MTSTRLNRALVFASTIWVVIALVRLVAWIAGHPGNKVSLTFSLIAGAAGVVALAAAFWPTRGQWSRTARELEEAVLLLREQLADAAPETAGDSPAMGCCGCGAWMADVRTKPSEGAPRGESYCWSCVEKSETLNRIFDHVLPGRGQQ